MNDLQEMIQALTLPELLQLMREAADQVELLAMQMIEEGGSK